MDVEFKRAGPYVLYVVIHANVIAKTIEIYKVSMSPHQQAISSSFSDFLPSNATGTILIC
jgi:hypothetical protein